MYIVRCVEIKNLLKKSLIFLKHFHFHSSLKHKPHFRYCLNLFTVWEVIVFANTVTAVLCQGHYRDIIIAYQRDVTMYICSHICIWGDV